jgi:hypothetical protein
VVRRDTAGLTDYLQQRITQHGKAKPIGACQQLRRIMPA